MSFFSDVAGPLLGGAAGFALGGPVGAAIGVGLGGAVSSSLGQSQANEDNYNLAMKQMSFQENMSNTAYQRVVKDMQAAGINPMLAISNGGASSMPGASATMQNTAQAMQGVGGTALDAIKTAQQIRSVDSQTKLNDATAMAQAARATSEIASAKEASTRTAVLNTQMPAVAKQAEVDFKRATFDSKAVDYDSYAKRVQQGMGVLNTAKDIFMKQGKGGGFGYPIPENPVPPVNIPGRTGPGSYKGKPGITSGALDSLRKQQRGEE